MLGGARNPAVVRSSDQTLIDTAVAAVRQFAGVKGDPRFTMLIRHERAIPQYVLGHADRLAAIDARLSQIPGLFLAGNSYRGIAINA